MTTIARPTPLSVARPTAPLPAPAAAALAKLESAFPEVVAELHRIERTVAGLHAGESTVINGTQVTAISLAVAEALTRYRAASKRTAAISKDLSNPKYKPTGLEWDDLAHAREVMTGSRDILAEAGMLELIGGR
jgi:hypothetical protein